MANPVLVEVMRGPLVESRHRGAWAVADRRGRLVGKAGDAGRPVFPRSAIKALQALAAVESGAADAFGLTEEEIALACASHNGEPRQVAAARSMLARIGLTETALECGAQPPRRAADQGVLAMSGEEAGAIHNNCSGKHAAMLALERHLGVPPAGYVRPDHPVQMAVRAVLDDLTSATKTAAQPAKSASPCAIDGCSVPTWAFPLDGLARAFARFATGEGLSPARAAACARIRRAVAAHPFMVAGTGRFCTEAMTATGPAAFVKTGAEGVACAGFPEHGLGFALKIDDGAGRAAEAVMATAILALCELEGEARATLERLANPPLTNWAGLEVGAIRLTEEAAAELRALG